MIHVCFGLHDKTGRYSKFTGTTMLSMFENTTSEVTIHILHDNTLTQDNREKFSCLAGQYGQLVQFYNVDELCADELAEYVNLVSAVKNSSVTVGAFYRLFIPQLLPDGIGKTIYLDSDMVVNLDISELWQIKITDKPLAAVPEAVASSVAFKNYAYNKYLIKAKFVNYEDYFNSGVLLINLNFFRNNEKLLMSGVKWRGEHTQCNAFDQDVLNYLFSKSYLKLPGKFDQFIRSERLKNKEYLKIRRVIYHYISDTLQLNSNDVFNRLWMSYFIKTPWFNEETIERLYIHIRQLHVYFKSLLINFTTILNGKTRTFVLTKDNSSIIKKLFSIQDDEDVIIVEQYTPLHELFEKMTASRGKKFFIIFVSEFPFINFEKLGFVYGRDFLNGAEFLSEAQGVPLNSYPLIQAM